MTDRSDARAAARAYANIALIKYWGKRDARLNLPAVGSISITLDALSTDTEVAFDPGLTQDHVELDGRPANATRVIGFLDLVRAAAGIDTRAHVTSRNNFPTGAGLASSASGFAALALAATRAAGLALDERALSVLARRGSGSAARSIHGGYVEMHRGHAADGEDACAEQLCTAADWPLAVVIGITEHAAKTTGSTGGMQSSAGASDYFDAWVQHAPHDLDRMRRAIAERDFDVLGEWAEYSCLKMHGLMLSTRPALIYWNAATVAAMHAVRALRADGVPVYFTIDAGPQLKALCEPQHAERVSAALAQVPGVLETRISGVGGPARLIDP